MRKILFSTERYVYKHIQILTIQILSYSFTYVIFVDLCGDICGMGLSYDLNFGIMGVSLMVWNVGLSPIGIYKYLFMYVSIYVLICALVTEMYINMQIRALSPIGIFIYLLVSRVLDLGYGVSIGLDLGGV
jgi:hypothetical protein